MTLKLPRLPINWREQPQLFERYWDSVLTGLEKNVSKTDSIVFDLGVINSSIASLTSSVSSNTLAIASLTTRVSTLETNTAFITTAQPAGTFYAAPAVSTGLAAFRAIAVSDVPVLNQNTTGNAGTASKLQTARNINGVAFDGTAPITVTANTPNTATFNNSGAGGVSGTTFNGSVNVTVSYNTVGAPSVTGAGASGTWPISVTGNAATATNVPWSGVTATPTTLAGYGITNGVVLGGALGTPSSGALTNCTFPTLNQNTTGTASNITGTAAVVNGGTGAVSLTSGALLKGNGTSPVTASVVTDDGTNVGIGRATPANKLDVNGSLAVADSAFVYTPYNGATTNTGTVRAGIQVDGTNQTLNFYTSNSFRGGVDQAGNVYAGGGATAMTDGFFYIPAAAGAPTGVPTAKAGRVPMYYDTTNNNFYVYNGAWKKVLLT